MNTALENDIKAIVGEALGLGARVDKFDEKTLLLSEVPEMDSMAVVAVITSLEERFGIVVYDDEISAATFETLATLAAFVAQKLEN